MIFLIHVSWLEILIPYGSTCTFLILTAAKSGIIYFILQTTSETQRSEETYPKLHS